MKYIIVAVDGDTVTVWDGVTMDSKHNTEPAGKMTIDVGPHCFMVGQKVTLAVRLVAEEKVNDSN